MATVIKLEDMNIGMQGFIEYWEANMLDMKKVNGGMINIAYFKLYNKNRSGGSCSSCLISVYNQLNSIYLQNKPAPIVEAPGDEVKIEEPIKTSKTKK